MTVTKADLADHLWETMGLTQREAMQMVDTFFDSMRAGIVADSGLMLSNFGRFTVLDKTSRPGRDPRTGQPYEIRARRVVTFSAGPHLRARCNPELPIPAKVLRRKPQ